MPFQFRAEKACSSVRRPWPAMVLTAVLVLTAPAAGVRAAGDLAETAATLVSEYAEKLEELAVWCDAQQLAEQASQTRQWGEARDPDRLCVAMLPVEMSPPKLPDDTPEGVVQWQQRFRQLRREQAGALYVLARKAIRGGRASLAFDLVMTAIRENPDHESIRKLLGYVKYQGTWRTLYEARRLRSGHVWHEKFGWLPRNHVARYEDGQRYCRGRWISAEQDARLHAGIQSGWDIQTEHYVIRTNHSREAAVALGEQLEHLYRVWKQLFIRYYATQAQVAALFDGRAARIRLPQHQIVYFRNRQEYIDALKPSSPSIEMSLGIYMQSMHTAYFFAGDGSDQRTLLHEATHQLFHESRKVPPNVAQNANFWIIEGIAMYMETLQQADGVHVLGGFDDLRMKAAHYRLMHDNFYVPFAEFTGYGMEKLQADPRIATLYSQAAGMTHFLIHYDGGRYRDALVAYLYAVYTDRADAGTLSRLTQTPYDELDRQYREFIERGQEK